MSPSNLPTFPDALKLVGPVVFFRVGDSSKPVTSSLWTRSSFFSNFLSSRRQPDLLSDEAVGELVRTFVDDWHYCSSRVVLINKFSYQLNSDWRWHVLPEGRH